MRAGLSARRARSPALAALVLACALALSACSELTERSLGSDHTSELLDAGLTPEPAPCMLSQDQIATMVEEQLSHLSEALCEASPLDRKCPFRICYNYLDQNCGSACVLYVLRVLDMGIEDYLNNDCGAPRLPFPP
jgi:hypothetical protein